jgi:DNA-binding beta-propeller fold protein YncE
MLCRMKRVLPGSLLIALSACSEAPATFKGNCTPMAPSQDALVAAGRQPDGTAILPGGRRLSPSGTVLTVGGFPLAMRALPAAAGDPRERYMVVTDGAVGDESLRIVDLQATGDPVVSKLLYPARTGSAQDPALFYGLALAKDGKRLYVSDGAYDPVSPTERDLTKHYNVIETFDLTGSPPQLTKVPSLEIHLSFNGVSGGAQQRLPAGMQLSTDERTLYVVNQFDGTLSIIDLSPGAGFGAEVGRTPPLGLAPYTLVVDEPAQRAYVSLWGGQMQGMGFLDGVIPVDLSNRSAPMPSGVVLSTEKAAEALLSAGGQLYVAASDGDAISVVDPSSGSSVSTRTAIDESGLFGSAPNDLAIDATAQRLYVANAGENAVQAFDLASMKSLGRIPTGWYPTAVRVLSDGTLVIASAKGMGGYPTDRSPGDNGLMPGVLQVVARPTSDQLTAGDATVKANLDRPRSYEVALACTGASRKFSLPVDKQKGPIEHVFLIVRENKTYDSELGDLPNTNGKPELTVWGSDITPNLHALAQRFANLDNFYSNAEQSIQGHEWTTTNFSNDYVEKSWLTGWGRSTRPLSTYSSLGNGYDHLVLPKSRTIFQLLDDAGTVYHNYGEAVNIGGAKISLDTNYPGIFFGLGVPDVTKIQYVIDNLNDKTQKLEPFVYIGLPNDHTRGTQAGYPTPQSMIADNDEATGRLVDALSHSKYWASSIVFIIEDDPSDGGDHVEMHRSPCVVASPWVRPGYNSSVHYDNPSLYKTMLQLLRVGPMNLYDAHAAAMVDLFSSTPDLRPFKFVPRKVPIQMNTADAPLQEESARVDWSRPDTAPLGRILWKAAKGHDAEPPWGIRPAVLDRDGDE